MPLEVSNFARSAADSVHRNVVFPHLVRGGAATDREVAHERSLRLLSLANNAPTRALMHELFAYEDPVLNTEFAGVELQNPMNLPAGFDKEARVHRVLGQGLGFGSVTVGTITKVPYEGNPRPRIFAPDHEHVLINRMGFPGGGAEDARRRLEKAPDAGSGSVLFVSIGASKPSFEKGTAIEDYVSVAAEMRPFGQIHEVNVSSPNTKGVRGLQEVEVFTDLAQALGEHYKYAGGGGKFMFKFSPDLPMHQLEELLKISVDVGASGVVLSNTSTDQGLKDILPSKYAAEAGGLSGRLIRTKATNLAHAAYRYVGEELPILSVGGIDSVEDIWDALTYRGAQVFGSYTAFVRKETSGPTFVYDRLKGLAEAMKRMGMDSMSDFKPFRGYHVDFPRAGTIFTAS